MKAPARPAAVAAGLALLAGCSPSEEVPATLAEGVYHAMEFGEQAALGPVDGHGGQEGVAFTAAEPVPLSAPCEYGDASLRVRVTIKTGTDPLYVNQLEGLFGDFPGDNVAIESDSGIVSTADINTTCGWNVLGVVSDTSESYTLDLDLDAPSDSGTLILTSPRVPDSGWTWEL